MTVDKERLGPPAGFLPGRPPKEARRPADKHFTALVRSDSVVGGKGFITMIDPSVDVQADIDAINRGEGFYHRETGRIWINERLYGTHTDHRRGTLYPVSGSGFFVISTLQHYALRRYLEFGGIMPEADAELARVRGITEDDLNVARELWRTRQKGGTP